MKRYTNVVKDAILVSFMTSFETVAVGRADKTMCTKQARHGLESTSTLCFLSVTLIHDIKYQVKHHPAS